jgi:hypothetical protein
MLRAWENMRYACKILAGKLYKEGDLRQLGVEGG